MLFALNFGDFLPSAALFLIGEGPAPIRLPSPSPPVWLVSAFWAAIDSVIYGCGLLTAGFLVKLGARLVDLVVPPRKV